MARPWLVSLVLVTHSATARAEQPPEAVRLEYSAPAECPDAESFMTQVRERTSRGRFAGPGELARTFTVAVNAEPPGFTGSVAFLDDASASVSRRVHGEQCEAVVESLALITALSLDATLREEEPPSTPVEPAKAAGEPTPGSQPLAPRAPSALPPRVTERSLESARLGLFGGYGSALAGARLGLLAELEWRSRFALRLAAHYDWHELTLDPGRSARLRQQGIEVSLCPRRLRWAAVAVSPCAALDLGSLRAEGVQSDRLTSVRADAVWWSSLALQLGVAYEPAVPIWVELRAAAELPLRAGYQFTFENPRAVAYEVPYFAGSAALAGGVRFW